MTETEPLLRSLLSCASEWNDDEAKLAERLANQLEAQLHGHPWVPLVGPQTQAVHTEADILGYGGAAGGGKSDMLLGLALTRHRRSILFRREAKQVRAMIDRAVEIVGHTTGLNRVDGIWRDLPGDRQIEFAGVKDIGSEKKYQGQPHDFVGFDEADSFAEMQVRWLMGWNRTTTPGQRCRAVLTFNPPSRAEGRWLLSFFGPWLDRKHPRPAKPGELRWYATLPNGQEVERPDREPFEATGPQGREMIQPRSRTFIPSRVTDNPHLMGTGYVSVLQAMPEPLRSQLLHGDFSAGLEDDAWQTIPTAWVEAAFARWAERGHAGHDPTALGIDVPYGGPDQLVIARRHGAWFAPLEKYPGRVINDGPKAAAKVVLVLNRWPIQIARRIALNVDGIGYGASCFDILKADWPQTKAIIFSEATGRRCRAGVLRFRNIRSYAYWSLREALDPERGDNLALPPDPELLADLTAVRYQPTASGIIMEPKDDVKDRIGRSPDCGDGVVLCHLIHSTPTARPQGLHPGMQTPRLH